MSHLGKKYVIEDAYIEAKARGDITFISKHSCRKCASNERYVSIFRCVPCQKRCSLKWVKSSNYKHQKVHNKKNWHLYAKKSNERAKAFYKIHKVEIQRKRKEKRTDADRLIHNARQRLYYQHRKIKQNESK